MAKGWEQHRLEKDGRWQATGQLRDPGQWPPPDMPKKLELAYTSGYDTLGFHRVFHLVEKVDAITPGTLAWAQFTRL